MVIGDPNEEADGGTILASNSLRRPYISRNFLFLGMS